jgi:microcin C transport system substrate-binding protein
MAVHIHRREFIGTLGSAVAASPLAKHAFTLGTAAFTLAPASLAKAVERPARHGISAFGDLKYAPDFKQFDYVNPNAPKGGVFSYV